MFNYTQPASPNDPEMINPKGVRIRVPESRVKELLSKGFILIDPNWKQTPQAPEVIKRDEPLPISQLREQLIDADTLNVIEI